MAPVTRAQASQGKRDSQSQGSQERRAALSSATSYTRHDKGWLNKNLKLGANAKAIPKRGQPGGSQSGYSIGARPPVAPPMSSSSRASHSRLGATTYYDEMSTGLTQPFAGATINGAFVGAPRASSRPPSSPSVNPQHLQDPAQLPTSVYRHHYAIPSPGASSSSTSTANELVSLRLKNVQLTNEVSQLTIRNTELAQESSHWRSRYDNQVTEFTRAQSRIADLEVDLARSREYQSDALSNEARSWAIEKRQLEGELRSASSGRELWRSQCNQEKAKRESWQDQANAARVEISGLRAEVEDNNAKLRRTQRELIEERRLLRAADSTLARMRP